MTLRDSIPIPSMYPVTNKGRGEISIGDDDLRTLVYGLTSETELSS